MANSEVMLRSPGRASRARTMGLAKASPTIASRWTPSRSMVSMSSSASKWRLVKVTQVPPPWSTAWVLNAPVPCISGQHGTPIVPFDGEAAAM